MTTSRIRAFAERCRLWVKKRTAVLELRFPLSSQKRTYIRTLFGRILPGRSLASEPSVAREITRRIGIAGQELPESLADFIELHVGPERQLMLRLA